MRNALDLFFVKTGYRRSTYGIAVVISIAYASVRMLAFHKGQGEVAVETVILFGLLIVSGIFIYSIVGKALPETPPSPTHTAHSIRSFVVALGGIVFVSVLVFRSNLVPTLQAFVLSARLESANDPFVSAYKIESPQSADMEFRRGFQDLQSIADVSYRYGIAVNARGVSNAEQKVRAALDQPRLSEITKQAGWSAYGKLYGLQADQEVARSVTAVSGFVISSHVDFSDKKLHFVGDHSTLIFNSGSMSIQKSIVVFDGINFRAPRPFAPSLYILGSDSSVVVRDATVENLDQTLDGAVWTSVEFRHSMIRVSGGAFTLVNVTFNDCDLRWLPLPFGGEVGDELLKKITDSKGQPVTFGFYGSQSHTGSKNQ